MKKLYIARGYNSWTHKDLIRAFNTEQDADQFMSGLTDPHLQILAYKSTTDLVNILLGNQEITA
jgi:hypothetical protein